jgi:hypothetical protein
MVKHGGCDRSTFLLEAWQKEGVEGITAPEVGGRMRHGLRHVSVSDWFNIEIIVNYK